MGRPVTLPTSFSSATSATGEQLDGDLQALQEAINDPLSYSNYGVDIGTADSYVVTFAPAVTTLTNGLRLQFKATNACTGSSGGVTLNPNGLGATPIVRADSSALEFGDIVGGGVVDVIYVVPAFRLIQPTQGFPFRRNLIHNGSLAVWQRGLSFTPAASTNTYTADRWCAYRAATGFTVSQGPTIAPSGNYAAKVQRTSGDTSTASISLRQVVESSDVQQVRGKTVTLSFWAQIGANFSGSNLGVTLYSGTVADEGSSVLGSWAGQTMAISSTAAATITPARFSFTTTVPVDCLELGLAFFWNPTGTAGTDDWFAVANVQLEVGGSATPFEFVPFALEESICFRYYIAVQYTFAAYTGGSGARAVGSFDFKRMRVVPTCTIDTSITNVNCGSVYIQAQYNSSLLINADPSAAGGLYAAGNITASADL